MEKHKVLPALLLAISFAACGIRIKSDPIKVEPIKVEHRIILDTEALYKTYQETCTTELPAESTQKEINTCADTKLNNFIEKFTSIG